jgi:hypothetical protein
MGDRVAEDREPSSSSSGCAGLTSTSTAYADYQKKTTHEIPLVELGPKLVALRHWQRAAAALVSLLCQSSGSAISTSTMKRTVTDRRRW